MKPSKAQKEVIRDLQNGYVLITGNQLKGAVVGSSKREYIIGTRLFWNLVDKGLVFQNMYENYNYTLTELGKQIEL